MIYSLDSCTLIFLFRKHPCVCLAFEEKKKDNVMLIPPIAYYEVLRGLSDINSKTKIEKVKALYQIARNYIQLPEKEVMEKAADIYIDLKRRGFTVGSNDIIIAAWSVLAGATLVTDNTKDFENINGLTTENWREQR